MSVNLSVIIPCYHNESSKYNVTQRCLNALKNSVTCEICIIENINSWCNSQSNIYVHYPEGRTYAQNVNTGLKLVNGEYIAVLSNDAIVPNGWYSAMLDCFKDDKCGIACIDSTQYARPAVDTITEDFFGSFWMAKREVIEKVGLFDENFVHAFDDADYWVRVYKAGYKILMNRKVQVQHKSGGTIYGFVNHNEQFAKMRELFNNKHMDCELDIFKCLR